MIGEIKLSAPFRPFPGYTRRDRWDALSGEIKSFYRREGAALKNREWESLNASLYLEFFRNGNRSTYQDRYFNRRRDLVFLMLAECIDGRGEYLDDIINGVWLICEETSWVVPAHNNHGRREGRERELPDIEAESYVDLFAAETASLLAWIWYFLGEAITLRAPLVTRRIEREVERRIFVPFLEKDNFFWMGLDNDKPVNNWNPWINSNLLTAFPIFAGVFPRAEEGINKAIRSLNRFVHFYAEDGGCEEGPSYFVAAGASLMDCIELLEETGDVSYLYQNPKIRGINAYIYRVYVAKDYYVNYADGAPSVIIPAEQLYRTGKKTGDANLSAFARYLKNNRYTRPDFQPDHIGAHLFRLLKDIFAEEEALAEPFTAPASSWFPGIQVMTARDSGFFVSAKGGNNNESHNHNDIGNFLLYRDGRPVLVDAGVEEYTKFTFNEKRYTLWTMQSCYHNTPRINGADQQAGAEYRASGVSFSDDGREVRFSLELAGAYGADAALEQYRRELVFHREGDLRIRDTYRLKEWKAPLILNLLCYDKPKVSRGRVSLGRVVLFFDAALCAAEYEPVLLKDDKIRRDWNKDKLYRLRLIKNGKDLSGTIDLRFTR